MDPIALASSIDYHAQMIDAMPEDQLQHLVAACQRIISVSSSRSSSGQAGLMMQQPMMMQTQPTMQMPQLYDTSMMAQPMSFGGTAASSRGSDPIKLFVGSLPVGITNDDLRGIFSRFGNLQPDDAVHILPQKGSRTDVAAAFVKYVDAAAAAAAIAAMHDKMYNHPAFPAHRMPMLVRYADGGGGKGGGGGAAHGMSQFQQPMAAMPTMQMMQPMMMPSMMPDMGRGQPAAQQEAQQDLRKLFVGSLPPQVSAPELAVIFSPFGELQVEDGGGVHVLPLKPGMGKACAFVKFRDEAAATAAVQALNDQHASFPGHPGHTDALLVRFADGGSGNWAKRKRF